MIKFDGKNADKVKDFLIAKQIRCGQENSGRLYFFWGDKQVTIFKGDSVFMKQGIPCCQIIISE